MAYFYTRVFIKREVISGAELLNSLSFFKKNVETFLFLFFELQGHLQ